MSDEYGVYYQPGMAAGQVARARAGLLWRIGSTVFSLALVGGAWWLWPEQFGEWAPWILGVSGLSGLVTVGFSIVQLLRARRDAALAGDGLAIGLNRDGMLVGQRWLPWPEVGSVVVRPAALGGSSLLVATGRDRSASRVPLDYTDTMPATLDTAVRVLSSGRAWLDLSRLD
jgi:hypothetical protein